MDRLVRILAIAVFVFLYIPIVAVIVYSFNASPVAYRWDGLTLEWYAELFTDRRLLETLQTSLIVALLSAVVATAIGFLTAYAVARLKIRGGALLLAAVMVPLIVPEIVLGVALLTVFSTMDVTNGIGTLVLGHSIVALPLATLVMIGAMSSLDPSLPEAATDLGASPTQVFTRVTLPLLRPSLLAAYLLSFATSFGNVVISTFTSGVGSTTLPLRIYSELRTGLTPELNALGALLVASTLLIIAVIGLGQLRNILAGPRTES